MDVSVIDEPIAASSVRSPAESARQGQTGGSELEQNVRPLPMGCMFVSSNDFH